MSPITQGLAVLCAVLAALAGVFGYLYNDEVKDHAEFRANVAAAQKQVADENERRAEEDRENTAKVAGIYSARLAAVERDYVSRLDRMRQQASRDATARATDAATRLPDAEPTDGRSDPATLAREVGEIRTEFRRLERDCAKTTLMLYGLQDYVFEVCK